jgi:hypothetical protein
MQILKSLKGRLLGLGPNGELICPGGFVSGSSGSQYALPSPGRISYTDDFEGDILDARWNVVEGTDSATSDAAILAGGIGGVLRITTGDAGTGTAADMVVLNRALQWQASNGDLVTEARLKLSAITTCYCFFGFTDTVAYEAPIVSAASADTITTTASDAVGFMFDTRMTTDSWWLVGVAADVDATKEVTAFAPVADTYEVFRVEVTAAGAANFYRNGIQVGATMAGAVTPGTDLTPVFAVSKTSVAASMTADVDVIHISMNR